MNTTINTTPARNQEIYNNYEKAVRDLSDLFENLAKHEAEHPGETFGYAGIPYCLQRVREKGINKIFFVGRDYHGKYEDDYCYFTYWDEDSKEFFTDEWGTWAAFPHYDLYEMPISFGLGWDLDLIDKMAYLELKKNNLKNIIKNTSFNPSSVMDYTPRVLVDGGRKWKGEGYLIDVTTSSYRYATPMYRSRYYGTPKDFGVSTTETAVIWNPIDNTINRTNLKYVKYLDADKIINAYKEWANKIVDFAQVYDIKSNNQYNNGSYDLTVDYSQDRFMKEVWGPAHTIGTDFSNAYDAEAEEKKKKMSELRAAKMPGIIEWVKEKTDKTDPMDIMELAIRIFNKNYNNE